MLGPRLPMLLAVAAIASPALAAQPFDGYYAGRLTCDAVAVKPIGPLNIAFAVTITGGNATYRRAIYSPDGKMHMTDETGEGKASADGVVTLSGRAEFMSWHYDASYAGKIAGDTVDLVGKQHWEFTDGTVFDRPCKATVKRG